MIVRLWNENVFSQVVNLNPQDLFGSYANKNQFIR